MTKHFPYPIKLFIGLLCFIAIGFTMLMAHRFIEQSHVELSDNIKSIIHQMVRHSSYSLGPLLKDGDTEDDTQQIEQVMQALLTQSWVNDVSIYRLDGTLVGQVGEEISVRDRLHLDHHQLVSKQTIQIVEKIDLDKMPVGFIRITINPEILQFDHQHVHDLSNAIYLLLGVTAAIGTLFGLLLASLLRRKAAN